MTDALKIGLLIGTVMGAASIMDVIQNSEPREKKESPKKKEFMGEPIMEGAIIDPATGKEYKGTWHKPQK